MSNSSALKSKLAKEIEMLMTQEKTFKRVTCCKSSTIKAVWNNNNTLYDNSINMYMCIHTTDKICKQRLYITLYLLLAMKCDVWQLIWQLIFNLLVFQSERCALIDLT